MNLTDYQTFNQHTTQYVFQLIKKYPPISINHDVNNNILSIRPLYDVASDVQFIKPTTKYTLEQMTVLVETTISVQQKTLTVFPLKPLIMKPLNQSVGF